MHDQRDVSDMGGTMRLGAYYAVLAPGTKVFEAYGEPVVSERHRHRYEFNNAYRSPLRGGRVRALRARRRTSGWWSSWSSPDHPFYVGTQAHPEFKSRPDRPTRCSGSSSPRP